MFYAFDNEHDIQNMIIYIIRYGAYSTPEVNAANELAYFALHNFYWLWQENPEAMKQLNRRHSECQDANND